MRLSVQIPGKTFVAGEYLVLEGGKALCLASQPDFQLKVEHCRQGEVGTNPFHLDSPAGKFWSQNPEFKEYHLKFINPYGRGGFGGSTAEYLSLVGLLDYLKNQKTSAGVALIEEYQKYFDSSKGRRPSGIDLWAQRLGGLRILDRQQETASEVYWPFEKQGTGFLIHTGHKLATHQHLQADLLIPHKELAKAFEMIEQGLNSLSIEQFILGLMSYSEALKSAGLMCENSQQLQQKISKISGVLAVKPCGAMGSDVLFVLIASGQESALQECLNCDKDLKVFSSTEAKFASSGLVVSVDL